MKRISEITRRDVFNLFLYGIDKNTDFGTELLHYNYSGKLSELDFLKRIYNLEQLPSYYQVFVGMLEININSAEVLYKQKEEIINE